MSGSTEISIKETLKTDQKGKSVTNERSNLIEGIGKLFELSAGCVVVTISLYNNEQPDYRD